jgi:hypothetical protein
LTICRITIQIYGFLLKQQDTTRQPDLGSSIIVKTINAMTIYSTVSINQANYTNLKDPRRAVV